MSPASPHPFRAGTQMKELNESNQLVNKHCQHRWEQGEGGEFHVSTKGKPFSLKKKKEQTRGVHGQTTGHHLCTRPASPQLKRLSQGHGHLASQPHMRLGQGGWLQEPLGERRTQNGTRKRASNQKLQFLSGLPGCGEQMVQREHRRQRQVSPLNSPK